MLAAVALFLVFVALIAGAAACVTYPATATPQLGASRDRRLPGKARRRARRDGDA